MPLSMIDTQLVTRWCASPNFGERKDGARPDMLVLHYTGMESHDKALSWLTDPQSEVSCHYIVAEDGAITQMVTERHRAWHAGAAHWQGVTDINSCSIGIEIHNLGTLADPPRAYPEAQMAAVTVLALDICARNGIPANRVLGHSDVSPWRKRDPGEHFDWARLYRAGVGIWVPPVGLAGDNGDKDDGLPHIHPEIDATIATAGADALGRGTEGEKVGELQRAFSDFGYRLDVTSCFDETTEQVVAAFQRHWRPARVDGVADASTLATFERVRAASQLLIV